MKLGAIFDMDGLMFDTERLYQEGWKEEASAMGIRLPDSFCREISGTTGKKMREIVARNYPGNDPETVRQRVMESVGRKLQKEVPVKPGLWELLEYLKKNGVRTAVASSSYPELIASNLRISGTEPFFDAVVSGVRVKRGKPEPDIFLLAAKELGLDAKDCYVFEDSINGVLAGLAAGSRTVMVPDCVEPDEVVRNSPAVICASLTEALAEIRSGRL